MKNKQQLVLLNLETFESIYRRRLRVCFEKSDIATRRNTNVIILISLKVIRKDKHSTVKNAKNIKHDAKIS